MAAFSAAGSCTCLAAPRSMQPINNPSSSSRCLDQWEPVQWHLIPVRESFSSCPNKVARRSFTPMTSQLSLWRAHKRFLALLELRKIWFVGEPMALLSAQRAISCFWSALRFVPGLLRLTCLSLRSARRSPPLEVPYRSPLPSPIPAQALEIRTQNRPAPNIWLLGPNPGSCGQFWGFIYLAISDSDQTKFSPISQTPLTPGAGATAT